MSVSFDVISQGAIAVLGVSSVFLVAKKNKWGFVLGVLSEPFWYYTTFHHRQWGIFVLNFFYLGSWSLGVYEWFYKKPTNKKQELTK